MRNKKKIITLFCLLIIGIIYIAPNRSVLATDVEGGQVTVGGSIRFENDAEGNVQDKPVDKPIIEDSSTEIEEVIHTKPTTEKTYDRGKSDGKILPQTGEIKSDGKLSVLLGGIVIVFVLIIARCRVGDEE